MLITHNQEATDCTRVRRIQQKSCKWNTKNNFINDSTLHLEVTTTMAGWN